MYGQLEQFEQDQPSQVQDRHVVASLLSDIPDDNPAQLSSSHQTKTSDIPVNVPDPEDVATAPGQAVLDGAGGDQDGLPAVPPLYQGKDQRWWRVL